MSSADQTYRDYRIVYLKDDHQAWVWAPGEDLAMINVHQRGEGETFDDLQRKAHEAIDADIDQRAAE